jgi:hypothetical protein
MSGEPEEPAAEFYARKSMLALEQIAKALDAVALAMGTLVAFSLPTLESIDAKLPGKQRTPKRRKRKRRKPRGLAASLVSLVLLVGCGGVVAEPVESLPVPVAESGVVRVAERDAGDGGHTIECTPDAEAHTGILCMHPKRQRRADGGAHQ